MAEKLKLKSQSSQQLTKRSNLPPTVTNFGSQN